MAASARPCPRPGRRHRAPWSKAPTAPRWSAAQFAGGGTAPTRRLLHDLRSRERSGARVVRLAARAVRLCRGHLARSRMYSGPLACRPRERHDVSTRPARAAGYLRAVDDSDVVGVGSHHARGGHQRRRPAMSSSGYCSSSSPEPGYPALLSSRLGGAPSRPRPLGRRRRNPEVRRMAMAATSLFTIGAGARTDGVCGTVSRSAGGRDAVDVAGSRPRAPFRWPCTATR